MITTPQIFYEFLENQLHSVKSRIFVNGKWEPIVLEYLSISLSPKRYESLVFLFGKILETEFSSVNCSKVALELSGVIVPCEVNGCNFSHNDIELSFFITYSSRIFHNGCVSNAEGKIPDAALHMLEIENDPKKKTFFDWIDLE